jgi:cysteinyl-tRNA synthetase
MDAIGVKRPTHDPHATAYVDQMVDLIARLVEKGAAYETSDGVYFRRSALPTTACSPGRTSIRCRWVPASRSSTRRRRPSTSRCGRRPSRVSRRGRHRGATGRPGWHTECVVMSLDLLGEGFDLHGGGQDLCFPHHENERAQAVADGKAFAHHWMHNGFVEVGGREDVQVARQLHEPARSDRTVDPRAYRCCACRRTTGRRST